MIPLNFVLMLAGILFALSVAGIFLNRKNVILLLMCIELMLLAVNFNFVSCVRKLGERGWQLIVFFILTIVVAESAIGLAILVVLIRERKSITVELLDTMKGGLPAMISQSVLLTIVLAPLLAAIAAGLAGK